MAILGFGLLAAFTDDNDVTEESLATFAPTPAPEPSATPLPTTAPEPTPTAAVVVESATTAMAGSLAAGGLAEVVNTDAATPVVEEFFVPSFVGAVDRSTFQADTSAPLEPTQPDPPATPAPTPPPAPQQAPTPTAMPTPEPQPTAEPRPEPTPTPEATAEPTPEPTSTPEPDSGNGGGNNGPTPEQWELLRQCESGGNYQIVSSNGLYHGAYQFSLGTWDSTASGRWPELVGVLPSEASPSDQDKMARRLYRLRGAGPWPTCGRYLP